MIRLGLAVYRWLLLALPADLRAEYGESMVADLGEAVREARARGVLAALKTWLAAQVDLIRRAPYEHWREREKTSRRERPMNALPHDIRYAVRGFARQPGVTALLVVTLSLGIAASVAVFSLINGVLLRPLPFVEPNRLVYLNETAPRWNLTYTSINYADFHQWRERVRRFDGMAVFNERSVNLADQTGSDRVTGGAVTFDYATVLGIRPILGRTFTPEEDRPNGPNVVVIGEGLWKSRFGSSPDVIGRKLMLDSQPYTIIGVVPRQGEFPGSFQLWLPLAADPNLPYQSYSYEGIGRLKAGTTLAQASADLIEAHRPIWNARDTAHVVSPVLEPLRDHLSQDYSMLAGALAIGVALVLLSACINVASTMLARAIFRQREITLRMALGANPGRVSRQLIVESVVLASVAGLIGVALGTIGLASFVSSLPAEIPSWVTFTVDWRTIVAAFAIVGSTAVLFGLAPAINARRQDARAVLGGSRSSLAAPQRRALHGFVIAEVALATVLLVGSGLLYRAYQRVLAVDPGFRIENVLSFRLSLPPIRYRDSVAQRAFFPRLAEQLTTIPGVERASWINCPPLGCHQGNFYRAEGEAPPAPGQSSPVTLTLYTSPGYFETLGIKLVKGRFLTASDGPPVGPLNTVISEDFARLHWPQVPDPVGRRFSYEGDTTMLTVAGVVGNVRHYGLDRPSRPTVYLPASINVDSLRGTSFAVLVRTRGSAAGVTDLVRSAVREIDPELPLYQVGTMASAVERSLGIRRVLASGLALFAALALILAVGGIYGVLSYVVGRRIPELGIRMALGAERGRVIRLVLGQGLRLIAIGLVVGVPLALVVGRFLSSQLMSLPAWDPPTIVAAIIVMGLTGISAALMPARRASGVDPKAALSAE